MWVVLALVLVAILGLGALSSQVSGGPTAAQAIASASARPAASSSAAPSRPAASASTAPSTQDSARSTQNSSSSSFLPDYQDPQPAASPNGFATILSLAVKLVIVLVLIYATMVGLRYFGNRTRRAVMGDSSINVLEKTPLAQNRELYLIDVADRVLLLGATSTSMTMLTEITDPAAVEELRNRQPAGLPAAEPFLNYLKKVGERARPIAAEVAAAATSKPSDLLKPADLLRRIEDHKLRLKESTLALQETEA